MAEMVLASVHDLDIMPQVRIPSIVMGDYGCLKNVSIIQKRYSV